MPQSATAPVFIGVDIGTTTVKAVMAGPNGARLDSYAAVHATTRPEPGAAEQDPAHWMRSVEAAMVQFAAHPMASRVAAIGITSQVNTHLFCGTDGGPLGLALTWQDTRPAAAAALLEARITPEARAAALGAPIPIDASHALARMAWMGQTRPDLWNQTAHVLLPKDFAIFVLTGMVRSDPISAVGLVGPDLSYAAPILDLVPRAASVLPSLSDPLDIVGTVQPGRPFAGVPVATGTMDAWAGMFGLGVARDGQAMYLSGTSEVLGVISDHRRGAEGIITFPEWRRITLHAGPTQSGGASLAWLSGLLSKNIAALVDLARPGPILGTAPLFLPHLDGERAPLWDAESRGVFANMTGSTSAADLTRAVMEGVAFSARMVIEALEEAGQTSIQTLRHGGGGAGSDIWCQIRANVLGRSMERVTSPETGAMGALVMAGCASGEMTDLVEATQTLISKDRTFEPDPAAHEIANHRYEAFKRLYRSLGPVNATLARASTVKPQVDG